MNILAIPARLRMLAALLGGHLRAAWNLAAPPLPPRRYAATLYVMREHDDDALDAVLLTVSARWAGGWGPLDVMAGSLPWSSADLTSAEVLRAYAQLDAARAGRRT